LDPEGGTLSKILLGMVFLIAIITVVSLKRLRDIEKGKLD
jgi:hypothetical protein